MHAALTREYFGRKKFGTINGLMVGIIVLGSLIGPILAGFIYDTLGSYFIVWIGFVFLYVVALISVATTSPVGTKIK